MRSRLLTIGLLAAALAFSSLTGWAADPNPPAPPSPQAPTTYACPMHPQIQATFPGSCPICRMALQAKGSSPAATPPANHAEHAHRGMSMGGMDMGMMNCPQCMMGMGGMSTKAAPAVPVAPGKVAPVPYRSGGGRRCGC